MRRACLWRRSILLSGRLFLMAASPSGDVSVSMQKVEKVGIVVGIMGYFFSRACYDEHGTASCVLPFLY